MERRIEWSPEVPDRELEYRNPLQTTRRPR